MRTHPDFLRQGAGVAILAHIIAVARSRGMTRLSLETGSGPAFEPALALYRRSGFVPGEAFGAYEISPFNQFLTRAI
jgi:putative acetyltransferase